MATLTDPLLARRMLERSIAHGTNPALPADAVTDLLTLAASLDALGATVYTSAGLDRAAAIGWQQKAALVSDQYDLGGGPGRTLDCSQWFAHCMEMAARFGSGQMSVLGERRGGRGIGSVTLTTGSEGLL